MRAIPSDIIRSMSGMVDDTRKLFQDLIAPELKALQEQVKALEASTASGFTRVEKLMDARFSALETVIGANKDVVLAQIRSLEGKVDSNHANVLNTLNIEKRLEQLERLQQAASAVADTSARVERASTTPTYASTETRSGKAREIGKADIVERPAAAERSEVQDKQKS